MNTYGLIIIIWYTVSLTIELMKHGEPREDKHNFWAYLMVLAVLMFLMWKAGTFN